MAFSSFSWPSLTTFTRLACCLLPFGSWFFLSLSLSFLVKRHTHKASSCFSPRGEKSFSSHGRLNILYLYKRPRKGFLVLAVVVVVLFFFKFDLVGLNKSSRSILKRSGGRGRGGFLSSFSSEHCAIKKSRCVCESHGWPRKMVKICQWNPSRAAQQRPTDSIYFSYFKYRERRRSRCRRHLQLNVVENDSNDAITT